jgi:hypothetical protein
MFTQINYLLQCYQPAICFFPKIILDSSFISPHIHCGNNPAQGSVYPECMRRKWSEMENAKEVSLSE